MLARQFLQVNAEKQHRSPQVDGLSGARVLRLGQGTAIEADREAISRQTFKDIDVLLLPTTTTGVPRIKDASTNPLALSPENTVFANYYGLPAMSVPCGFDRHGLPLGLQIVAKP